MSGVPLDLMCIIPYQIRLEINCVMMKGESAEAKMSAPLSGKIIYIVSHLCHLVKSEDLNRIICFYLDK